jgi:hypothetical protein
MMKLSRMLMFLALVVLAVLAMGNIDPTTTRFDDAREGSYGVTVDLEADADTVLWIGFKCWTGTVTRMNVDVIVEPLTISTRQIVDGPTWQTGRSVANPRSGSSLYDWGPDTLTTTNPIHEFCCDGLIGYRITAIDTTGYVKVYATGGRP